MQNEGQFGGRPQRLTENFFISLNNQEARLQGVFQIVQFQKKRESVYSTRMSDGYFKIKVILTGAAAAQFQSQAITHLSILRGHIRNHGDGVFIVKEPLTVWRHEKVVGCPQKWKARKENVNLFGSSIIKWEDSPASVKDTSMDSSRRYESGTRITEETEAKAVDKSEQRRGELQLDTDMNSQDFAYIHSLVEKRQLLPQQKIEGNRSERRRRLAEIISLLSESSEQKPKKAGRLNVVPSSPKPIIDTSLILKQLSKGARLSSGSDSDSLTNYLERRRNRLEGGSPTQDHYAAPFTRETEVEFKSVYFGEVGKIWWCKMRLKAIGEVKNASMPCVLADIGSNFLLPATFKSIELLHSGLEEGKVYRITQAKMKQSQRAGNHAYQLDIDCGTVTIQEDKQFTAQNLSIQVERDFEETQQGYCRLENVYKLPLSSVIHCFGVVKSFRQSRMKGGKHMGNIDLVDVVSSYVVGLTIFDMLPINDLQDHIITIYNVEVVLYKNKIRLNSLPSSILKVNWLPKAPDSIATLDWVYGSNNLAGLVLKYVGFKPLLSLEQLQKEKEGGELLLEDVEIVQFESKLTYSACVTCFKKVEQNRCRQCGFRDKDQIFERVFLRGQIGNSSGRISVTWEDGERLMLAGIDQLRQKWMLRNIRVWIRKGEEIHSVIQMELKQIQGKIQQLLEYLGERLHK